MSIAIPSMLKDQTWSLDADWTMHSAEVQANKLGLAWDDSLLAWVQATRRFYIEFDHAPNTRVLIKFLKQECNPTLSSLTLQVALKANPALVLSYLSGIPKPKQCF